MFNTLPFRRYPYKLVRHIYVTLFYIYRLFSFREERGKKRAIPYYIEFYTELYLLFFLDENRY